MLDVEKNVAHWRKGAQEALEVAGDLIADRRLEPIAVGEQQYTDDDSSFIIETARREGQIIPLAE